MPKENGARLRIITKRNSASDYCGLVIFNGALETRSSPHAQKSTRIAICLAAKRTACMTEFVADRIISHLQR
jgi:hypothetical protein